MRFAEENEDYSVRMPLANLGNLHGGVTVAGSDLAQVFARHAIESVKRFGMVASRDQQFVERHPVVAPFDVEADALSQFGLVDLATPPFVENVLVTGEDGLNPEHDRTVARQCALLDQRSC